MQPAESPSREFWVFVGAGQSVVAGSWKRAETEQYHFVTVRDPIVRRLVWCRWTWTGLQRLRLSCSERLCISWTPTCWQEWDFWKSEEKLFQCKDAVETVLSCQRGCQWHWAWRSMFVVPRHVWFLEFQTAILSIQRTQHFCHNVRMGIICSPFLSGRKLFSNVFQKWHCFSLSGAFHVLLFGSVRRIRITVVVSVGCSGVPVFSSAVSLQSMFPFLLRKENKTKFFFPVFPPYPLPPRLPCDECVSSVLKTRPQKYKIDK